MIVYLEGADGGWFIDCTDKDTSVDLPVPHGLAGRRALLLDPEDPRLARLPDYPAPEPNVVVSRKVQIAGAADFQVEETLTLGGYYAGFMRSYLNALPASRRKSGVQSFLDDVGSGVELQSADVEGLQLPEAPLVVHLQYRLKRNLHGIEDRLAGAVPALWEHYYLASSYAPQRETPFKLDTPLHLNSRMELEVPAELSVASVAPPGGEHDGPFLRWETEVDAGQENRVVVQCTLRRHAGRHPASAYADYHQACENARQACSPNIILRKSDDAD
jgi:hypothetical protein